MNPEEYAKLEAVEMTHWFYAGKRHIVFDSLAKARALAPDRLLVDCGAGTGRFAREASARCNAIAVDDHEESLAIARKHLGSESVRRGSCTALPLADEAADVVTALDVIEHVEDDARAVREMARILKPGGLMVITVPAFQALWSDWDVILHHFRRYRRRQLRDLLASAGLEVERCDYINVLVFPAVWLLRKWRTLFPRPANAGGARAEERIPPPWLNRLLFAAFVAPACQTLISFPFGVGLLAVARKAPTANPPATT
jgi:SAM-dependent methyltransferase